MKILFNRIVLTILSTWCICLNANAQTNPPMRTDSAAAARIAANMVTIEGGTYMMGCNGNPGAAQGGCGSTEQPAHEVKVKTFELCKYLVTQDEWKAIMDSYPKSYTGCGECPVDDVSLEDAFEFIDKLNRLTGKSYYMPDEKEWEFAARGGNLNKDYLYPGNNNPDSVAWYKENSGGHTHPVGLKAPNELGLYDMKGEVYEWCNSPFKYYETKPTRFPGYVLRGSTCLDDAWICRITWRGYWPRAKHLNNFGFRLAVNYEPPVIAPDPPDTAAARKIALNMVTVQGGSYMMGCNGPRWWEKDNGECWYAEEPAHQVSVGSFKICKYVVTRADWKAVMGYYPKLNKNANICPDCPVDDAKFKDALAFIEKLNKLTGRHYRLPTEEEWEFAARGGNLSRGYKYPGSDNPDEVAWYKNNSGGQTHPVGQKAPNELGLYDMAGNSKQWCNTLWKYYGQTIPERKDEYVIRGSAIFEEAVVCLVTNRFFAFSDVFSYGFRLTEDSVQIIASAKPDSTDKIFSRQTLARLASNMVAVQGGSYIMGCTGPVWKGKEHHDCENNELPAHQVSVGNFKICKYVVTQADWKAVMGSYPKPFEGCDNYPVDDVKLDDVQDFIKKLNQLTGRHYRLPTEEEWEFAARGGNLSRHYVFPGGDDPDEIAWYNPWNNKAHRRIGLPGWPGNSYTFGEKYSDTCKIQPVGMKAPNELGLYDMAGNVPQWCSTRYESYYNPMPKDKMEYVTRGSAYFNDVWACRIAHREGSALICMGFRLAED